jgi:hypothetical protein
MLITEVVSMASELQNELAAFHRFVGEQLGNCGDQPSPEECLQLWRAQHPSPSERDATVTAVKRALDQADRGEGKNLEQFDRDFRDKHGIPRDA